MQLNPSCTPRPACLLVPVPVRPDLGVHLVGRHLQGLVKPVLDVVVEVLPVFQLTPEVHQLLPALNELLLEGLAQFEQLSKTKTLEQL